MKDIYETSALFLMQSTLGSSNDEIIRVSQMGKSDWINEQFSNNLESQTTFLSSTESIWEMFKSKLLNQHGQSAINGDGNNPALPYWYYFRMAWWNKALGDDGSNALRIRIAQALSEIVVISDKSNLQLDALGMASFYDILYKYAFGNYGDILTEISMHPAMGVYLSHINNQKEDKENNIHPDENYAREIMQLFSIGLNELNSDGTEKIGADGNPIPTYTNNDIKELAKVFTGLKGARYRYEYDGILQGYNNYPISFDDGVSKAYKTVPFISMTEPMVAEEAYHDQSTKVLLNGKINIPAGQSTEDDIKKVVSGLMQHPNTAPFIAKKMIQQLVTSNPSPAYVAAAASAFGTTGNMKAMIESILTHSEATQGKKLKSPFLRATQILKAFSAYNKSGKLWVIGDQMDYLLQQHVLSSPTVFNFYLPDYVPHGPIEDANMVAPEFQIHNSATSIAYVNLMYNWIFGGILPTVSSVISSTRTNVPELDWEVLEQYTNDKLYLDLSYEISLASEEKFDELISHIALKLIGRSNIDFAQTLKSSFSEYANQPEWVVQTIIFMIVISPEFAVLKG